MSELEKAVKAFLDFWKKAEEAESEPHISDICDHVENLRSAFENRG